MPPTAPIPPPSWPIPKFDLRVEDLGHEGASIFFDVINPITALREAVTASFKWLYTPETTPTNVKVILLVLKPMEGVAHTFGTQSHKEIHFSLDHIVNCKNRAREEIMGVLVHEVVHCYQYNALDTCPGGLIEGIADFVRLHEGLEPPHWKRVHTGEWDAGYQTTAYFLDWIEMRYGEGTIRELNEWMKERKYHRRVFKELTGRPVRKLWKIYCAQLAATEAPQKPAFKAKVDGETEHGGDGDPGHLVGENSDNTAVEGDSRRVVGEDSDTTAVEGDTRRLVGDDSDHPNVDENTKSEGEGDNWLVIDKQPDL